MTALLTCPSCENKFRVYMEGTALKEAIEGKITIEQYNSGAFDFKCHQCKNKVRVNEINGAIEL